MRYNLHQAHTLRRGSSSGNHDPMARRDDLDQLHGHCWRAEGGLQQRTDDPARMDEGQVEARLLCTLQDTKDMAACDAGI